ncbi:DUF4282 domain-containing protein [Acinetobacter sp. B10A]|uniref:DUF4282 domain-containing protein n=1 Tax=Acinetobacter baretiae TaxID=2605383 RepID=UPI001B3C7444|nr:DUF4282 domain-containing protein [Acinetobacter baretiae]MBF7686194.1 DUF4282 domain-containing protein [Acinetobacter baretiae]
MKSILFLDAVLSTKIVTLAYWLMLLTLLVFGVGVAIDSIDIPMLRDTPQGFRYFASVAFTLLGAILVRLWAEFTVVMFKIQQNTRRTAELLEQKAKSDIHHN